MFNNIHYAVRISTNTTKSSPNVGLYNGAFRFVTDGYDMSNAVDEDAQPIENAEYWYTNFITKKGVKAITTQIDITEGGDQAWLSTATVDIVNITDLGYSYHDALKDITNLFPIASEMVVYVIINDVVYTRWVGKVSDAKFKDNIFSWVGVDKNNDSNDIISDEVYGYVDGVPATFIGERENIWKDVLVYEFGAEDTAYAGYSTTRNILPDTTLYSLKQSRSDFTGFCGLDLDRMYVDSLVPVNSSRYVQVENLTLDTVFANDFITFNDTQEMYVIREVKHETTGSKFVLDALDSSIVDYSQMFQWDPYIEIQEPIKNTLLDPEGASTISIWKQQYIDIAPSDLPNSDYIVINLGNGDYTTVSYTLDDDGNVLVGRQLATAQVKPKSVKYFSSTEELFKDGAFNTPSGDWYDTIPKDNIYLENDLDATSSFYNVAKASYHYFELDFTDGGNTNTYELSLMLKGVLDNTIENWQDVNDVDGWDQCVEDKYDDGTTPNHGSMTIATDATTYGQLVPETYNIKVFKLNQTPVWGSIPVTVGNILLLNTRKIESKISHQWNPDRYGVSMFVTNLPATNIPYYNSDVLSTYGPTIAKQNVAIDTWDYALTTGEYPDTGSTVSIANGSRYVVQITGESTSERVFKYKDTNGTETTYTEAIGVVPNCPFRLNGFSLTTTESITGDSDGFDYVAEDVDTNTYPKLAEELTGTQFNITSRDGWKTGKYVNTPTPRHNLITSLMKQGFVGGYINRFGNHEFRTFLDRTGPTHNHDNNIIIDKSIKSFSLTNINKVYNEFNIKWNYKPVDSDYTNEAIIKNVTEEFFPATDSNWTDYVSGIPNYQASKYYWEKCREAYLVSKTINQAPSNRTDLEFAYEDTVTTIDYNVYLNDGSGSTPFTVTYNYSGTSPMTVGTLWKFSYPQSYKQAVLAGDIIYMIDSANDYWIKVEVVRDITTVVVPKWTVKILDSNMDTVDVSSYDFIGEESYIVKDFGEYIASERLRLIGDKSDTNEQSIDKDFNTGSGVLEVGETCHFPKLYLDSDTTISQVGNTYYMYQTPSGSEPWSLNFMILTVTGVDPLRDDHWNAVIVAYENDSSHSPDNDRTFHFTNVACHTLTTNAVPIEETYTPEGYPLQYLDSLVNWTTYQKYQVTYSLPITDETVKYELLDNVIFTDPIITPVGQHGVGWITKYVLNPTTNKIDVQITFEPDFLVRAPIVGCTYINEDSSNTDWINEDENNTDWINEGECPNN